jgi:predicted nucleotidyltransferase
VFGSYAREEQDAYSDVDIVVIKDTQERFLDRLAAVYQHVLPDFAMDVLVYTPREFEEMASAGNPLIERIQSEGIVLYERA